MRPMNEQPTLGRQFEVFARRLAEQGFIAETDEAEFATLIRRANEAERLAVAVAGLWQLVGHHPAWLIVDYWREFAEARIAWRPGAGDE